VIICIDYCHNSLILITFYLAKSDHIMRLPLYILNIFNERVEFMILTHRWLGSRWLTYFFLGQRPWNVNGCFLKCEMCFRMMKSPPPPPTEFVNLPLPNTDTHTHTHTHTHHTHTAHTFRGQQSSRKVNESLWRKNFNWNDLGKHPPTLWIS